jgi:thiamine pyrophosphate-dependent acetolactate synthase large subunit-like protein
MEAAFADAIGDLGQGVVFGLMGDDVAKLIARVAALPGVEYFGARHEAAAVSMADGYARATGQLSICIVSRGPGFTNALTGIVAARKAGSPLLVILGDTSKAGGAAARSHPKHVDQDALTRACGALSYRVDDARAAMPTLGQAAAAAVADTTVAVLNVAGERPAPGHLLPMPVPDPVPEDIARVADLLADSQRPILIAGRGAIPVRDQLVALATSAGALLGTTLRAKDLFAAEPANIGIVGGFAHPLAREVLAEADCVVAFGASLNSFTTGGGKLFPGAAVCRVALGTDPSTSPLVLSADAGAVAQAVRGELERRGAAAASWPVAIVDRVAAHDPGDDIDDRSTAEAVDPRSLLAALDDALPRDRAVVLDAGHFTGFAVAHLTVPGPRRFTACLDYAAMAVGHGTALGFCIANRGVPTILVIGDGGLLMSLGEIDTASRYGLPLIVVVINDAAFGAELHYLELNGVQAAAETTVFDQRDFSSVAAALGATSAVIRSTDEARAAAQLAAAATGPVVLDCRVVRDVRALWLEELFTETDGAFGR